MSIPSNCTVTPVDTLPEREAIPIADRWDLSNIYPDLDAWEKDWARIEPLVESVETYSGRLQDPATIVACWREQNTLLCLVDRLYNYAELQADEDKTNRNNQALFSRIQGKDAEVKRRLAWFEPQILGLPAALLEKWQDENAMEEFQFLFTKLVRRQPHTLSEEAEKLLAGATEIFAAPEQIFGLMASADLRFPSIIDSAGQRHELSNARYNLFLQDQDRQVRRTAYEAISDTYGQFRNTFAANLATAIKKNNYLARVRNFPDALHSSLHRNAIPIALYENLTKAAHEALPYLYGYHALYQQQLGVPDLRTYDLLVSLVPGKDLEIPFAQAKEWITAALAPLGAEYGGWLQRAFNERWIDVYESRGKLSTHGYCRPTYGCVPHVLFTYKGTFDHVLGVAHELGHAINYCLTGQHQPYHLAQPCIATVEIASTLNEILLIDYLLEQVTDKSWRLYLLNHQLETCWQFLYRYVEIAEFEFALHQHDADGHPLTATEISNLYGTFRRRYLGSQVQIHERDTWVWMRIAALFMNFYVYNYSTSYCVALIIAQRIHENPAALEQYLNFLRAGDSADPLDLIKQAGVDLLAPETLNQPYLMFRDLVQKFRAELEE